MTNVSNYQSPYPKTSDYLNTPQPQNISSPTGISSATLNKLNDQITSVNNDLASLATQTKKDGIAGDKAAFSSDTAQIASDYAKLSSLASQVSSATQGLSGDDAKSESAFLGDASFTTELANGALSWGPSTAAAASAISSGTAAIASLSTASGPLSRAATSNVSTNFLGAGISTLLPTSTPTYDWNALANWYNQTQNGG